MEKHAPKVYVIYYRHVPTKYFLSWHLYFYIYSLIKEMHLSIHNDKNNVPVPKWTIWLQERDEDLAFPVRKLSEVFLLPLHWSWFQPETQEWPTLTFCSAIMNISARTKAFSSFVCNCASLVFLTKNNKVKPIPTEKKKSNLSHWNSGLTSYEIPQLLSGSLEIHHKKKCFLLVLVSY